MQKGEKELSLCIYVGQYLNCCGDGGGRLRGGGGGLGF